MEEIKDSKKIDKKGKLSILSLIFFIVRVITILALVGVYVLTAVIMNMNINSYVWGFIASVTRIVCFIPWGLVSLILAIVGKVKDKDRLSMVMLILNIVYIAILSLAATAMVLFLAFIFIAAAGVL